MELSYFPRHNGHRAWPYYADTIHDAAVEDLFWRKIQTERDFAIKVIKAVWPQAEECEDELRIGNGESVSLSPESCGAFCVFGTSSHPHLYAGKLDEKLIQSSVQNPEDGGYFLGPLIAKHKGWLPSNVVRNLMQVIDVHFTTSDRVRFNSKACHKQIFMNEHCKEEYKTMIENTFPAKYKAKSCTPFWYRTENGAINFGIIHYYDENGKFMYKLPISAWKPECPRRWQTIVYDMLNITGKYPLYNLDKLVCCTLVEHTIICQSEATVEHIVQNYAWILHRFRVTTYSDIYETDWSKHRCQTPLIFPEATESGCREAFHLYDALAKQGFRPLFLKRQKGSVPWSQEFSQDVGKLAYDDAKCSLSAFAEHCQQVFGIQPPEGVLPKGVPLSSLSESTVAHEILLEGLLNAGEQLMIHAWRGVGKSLFSMLLALCFASGKSVLNGRVCPSRKYHVLLLDGEMSVDNLKRRARKLCFGHGLPYESMNGVKLRSPLQENKSLAIDAHGGFDDLKPDMMVADIIIIDSVFKFFPSAMSSKFGEAEDLLAFLGWCRKLRKTLILIDHEGKNAETSFGTMGKEIALDSVLRLCKRKSDPWIKAIVKKVRDHAERSGAYLEMQIDTSEEGEKIAFKVRNEPMAKAALEVESSGSAGEAELPESSAKLELSLDEAIVKYAGANPDTTQGKMAADLEKMEIYGGRSTIQARIKVLSEAGKLPHWRSRPKSHKRAVQPASEGDA